MWKIIVEKGKPQTAVGCMRTAGWIAKSPQIHTHTLTHTLRIFYTYCFSNATMVARTRPTVTIIRTSRVILNLDVATVRSVAFSKARLAQLQACLIMCLATGGKRCGVYCVATDRKCITLPEILPVVSPLCTV